MTAFLDGLFAAFRRATENEPVNVPNAQSELNSSVASLREDQREALAAFIKTIV